MRRDFGGISKVGVSIARRLLHPDWTTGPQGMKRMRIPGRVLADGTHRSEAAH